MEHSKHVREIGIAHSDSTKAIIMALGDLFEKAPNQTVNITQILTKVVNKSFKEA